MKKFLFITMLFIAAISITTSCKHLRKSYDDAVINYDMKYIVSTVPLSFTKPVNRLTVISVKDQEDIRKLMQKINKE